MKQFITMLMKMQHSVLAFLLGFIISSSLNSPAFAQENLPTDTPLPSPDLGWIIQPPIEGGIIRSLTFIDRENGWYSGDNYIYRTINGGSTWQKLSPCPAEVIYNMKFFDLNVGWAVGSSEDELFKTTDGGINWTKIHAIVSHPQRISFISADTGFVLGVDWKVARTTDGGKTWTWSYAASQNSGKVKDIAALDGTHVTVIGEHSAWPEDFNRPATTTILTSGDGGKTWYRHWSDNTDSMDFSYITSVDSITQIAYEGGSIFRSTNRGGDWVNVLWYTTSNTAFTHIAFSDPLHGIAVGLKGVIYATNDGGKSWNLQPTGTIQHLTRAFMFDSLSGLVVGVNGIYLRTTNGGLSWVKDNAPIISDLALQTYPDPASNSTTLQFTVSKADYFCITIYDVVGRVILSPVIHQLFPTGTQRISIEASGLPKGQYTCLVEEGHSRGVVKFRVVR